MLDVLLIYMFAAASIAFNSEAHPLTLDELSVIISKQNSLKVTFTQWEEYGTVIPQILVHAEMPFTIQIDDDISYVPEEIHEWPDYSNVNLTPEEVEQLKTCQCRLDVMATTKSPVIEDDDSITVIATGNNVDPAEDATHKILFGHRQGNRRICSRLCKWWRNPARKAEHGALAKTHPVGVGKADTRQSGLAMLYRYGWKIRAGVEIDIYCD